MPESALELKTTPGNYRCTWLLSKPADEECWYSEGDIDLRASRQPYGGVYGRAPINFTRTPGGGISYGAPQYFRYPVVHGQLLNGRNVALVDPVLRVMDADRSSGMFPGPNAHFDAWAALVGRGIPRTSDILVDSGVVQISHLDTFAAKGPIEETRYSRNPFEDEDPRFEVKFQQASYQVWSDDAAEVAVEYQISAAVHGGYHFGVTFSPTIRIELSEPIPFKEFFTSWVLPLHGLVSASTGRNEDITYWSCSPLLEGGDNEPPARRQFAIFNRWITQQPYASDNSLRDKHLSAIRLAEGDSLLHLLRRWQTLEAEQNPILNTYDIHSLGPDQAPRARFLLLLQALEGLCGHEDRLGGRWASHVERRQRILDDCRGHLSGSDFRFLKQWLGKTPYSLDHALEAMLTSLPVDLEPELAQTELVKRIIDDEDSVTTTFAALRYARNKLSHGTGAFEPLALHAVAQILGRAVRGHLFRLLDASPEAQERVIRPADH